MQCKIRSYNYVRAEIFGKKPTWMNRAISLRSKPQVHTEIQYSERFNSISFSSTMQDGDNGCRFKEIKYSHELQRWDTVIAPMTDEEEDLSFEKAKAMIAAGIKYDLVGQLAHLFKFKLWKTSRKGKMHCTRAVGEALYVGRPDFFDFLKNYKLDLTEIKPDQLDMMARYYFERLKEST